jgi:hypothetical protein
VREHQHGPFIFRPALAPGRRWRTWTALALAGLTPAAGCYASVPIRTAPPGGSTVMLDLNDRGRVALGDQLGPSAARVEGVIQAQSDTMYVLRISSVQYLNGQSNRWSGEPFSIPSTLVASAKQREFSRARTVSLGLGLVGALIAVVLSTNFLTHGTAGPTVEPPPGGTS